VTSADYFRCDPPRNVVDGVLRLMDKLDLEYSSADVIETESGQFYFLDLNATGAWWWVDDAYNGAISSLLVDELAGGSNVNR